MGEVRAGHQVTEKLVGAAHLHGVDAHVRFDIGQYGVVVDEVQVNPGGVHLENFAHVTRLRKDNDFDFLNVEVCALKRQVFDAL
ncbi:hypothetical protein D3C84_996740 [compost metagenome]